MLIMMNLPDIDIFQYANIYHDWISFCIKLTNLRTIFPKHFHLRPPEVLAPVALDDTTFGCSGWLARRLSA